MTLARIALLCLTWLMSPANLIGGSTFAAIGWGAGYLKGHAVATRRGDTRVKAAVTHIETTLETKAQDYVKAADDAAASVPPVVPGPAHRPDRAAIVRLCASDPTCRRDGS